MGLELHRPPLAILRQILLRVTLPSLILAAADQVLPCGDRLAQHPIRRELSIIDGDGGRNLDLAAAVTDATATIDAFLTEGSPTVVHCHGGASRTGLVLRAWLMRRNGWDEAKATAYLTERWPDIGLWTEDFTDFLRDSWH